VGRYRDVSFILLETLNAADLVTFGALLNKQISLLTQIIPLDDPLRYSFPRTAVRLRNKKKINMRNK
jgi:hypothetical protein